VDHLAKADPEFGKYTSPRGWRFNEGAMEEGSPRLAIGRGAGRVIGQKVF